MKAVAATHYDVLELAADATQDEIRHAYSSQLRRFSRAANSPKPLSAEALDALRLAFKTLSDPASRQAYDRELAGVAVAQEPVAAMPVPIERDVKRTVLPATRPTPNDAEAKVLSFSFAGSGGEYFRIWIVNLLLTILTLGIYSAWAKVRREQYFHRNLLLEGSGFDYHGQPWAILKGRVIAALLLILLSMAKNAGPAVYGITVLALLPVFPWLLIKAFRFRARNTSYRGLHFGFDAKYLAACRVFLGYGLLTLLTLGLAFPLFYRQLRKFLIDHLRYGSTRFVNNVSIRQIYGIFMFPGVLFLILLVAIILVGKAVAGHGAAALLALSSVVILLSVMIILGQFLLLPYFTARATNAIWGNTALGDNRFDCDLPVVGYIGIYLSNLLAIAFSLGLLIPWARVRLARYRAEHLYLHMSDDLEDFIAGEREAVNAVGEEVTDMLDLDIGL